MSRVWAYKCSPVPQARLLLYLRRDFHEVKPLRVRADDASDVEMTRRYRKVRSGLPRLVPLQPPRPVFEKPKHAALAPEPSSLFFLVNGQ